jgi:predicted Zn finger-like uncharacterized protein
MRIVCPTCDTGYTVPDAKIGSGGRLVRCARCGTRWQASLPEAEEAMAAELDPVFEDAFAGLPADADFDAPPPIQRAAAARAPVGDPFDDLADPPDGADFDGAGFDGPGSGGAEDPPARAAEPATIAPDFDVDDFDAPEFDAPGVDAPANPALRARDPDDSGAVADEVGPSGSGRPAEAPDAGGALAAADEPKSIDVETLAKKPVVKVKAKPKPKRQFKLPQVDVKAAWTKSKAYVGLAILIVALIVPAVAVLARGSVVRAVPALAGLYRTIGLPVNLRGLEFQSIETLRELDSGQQVLVVEGAIVNVTGETRPIPTVRLSLRGDDSQEIYAWSVEPKSTTVAPGASVRFRTKLAAPPDDARDVLLRFTDRRSRQAAHP